MRVVELCRPESRSQGLRATLCRLIETTGTREFETTLAKLGRDAFGCDQITAFAFAGDWQPRLLNLSARVNKQAATRAATSYLQRHWRHDPSNIFSSRPIESDRSYLVFLSAAEVEDSEYRQDCYTSTGISHRVSLVKRHRGEYLKISLHRPCNQGSFHPTELAEIFDHADLLVELLLKHARSNYASRTGADAGYNYSDILARCCPALTKRERQVCSLIAIGLTSDEIAGKLGISINTVGTLRWRAYARLNISSQNELLRLILE